MSRRFLLENGNVLVDAPAPLVKFLRARRSGASKEELLQLKLAAQLTPGRAQRMVDDRNNSDENEKI